MVVLLGPVYLEVVLPASGHLALVLLAPQHPSLELLPSIHQGFRYLEAAKLALLTPALPPRATLA